MRRRRILPYEVNERVSERGLTIEYREHGIVCSFLVKRLCSSTRTETYGAHYHIINMYLYVKTHGGWLLFSMARTYRYESKQSCRVIIP
jgi:hypothetical protein